MMRFCTSRSLNTSTTSTRFSDSPTTSIWVTEAGRGRAREQLRPPCDQVRGAVAICLDLAADLGGRRLIEGPQLQQRIDEEPVTLVGGHAPGGGVGRGDEAELLEIRHHVAHRGRGELQARLARQGPRADRLAVTDVGLDEDPQQVLCPLA